MKTLKKAAVIFMMLLLITTSFTYSVHADDDQTADDASSQTVEVMEEENKESLPEEATKNESSEVIETDKASEENAAEEAAQETEELSDNLPEKNTEEPEETKKYITISYMFADATARDGVGSLPEEIMILLPEKETVEQGCDYEPKMPKEMEVSGYVFNGYEPFVYDNGDILYQGIWYKAGANKAILKAPMLRAAGSESFGYGGQQNWGLTGGWGYNGHNGFSIGGEESWCIDAAVPLSEIGTSYDPLGSSSGRAAEIIAMGKMNGRSQAEIQAALWNEEGYASYVNGAYIDPNDSDFNSRGMYGYSVSTWGGAGLQTQAKSPSWWPLGGYVKVYKKAADTTFNYTANCPNNYSLAGAVYGVYSDSSCTSRVARLTTNTNGETGTTGALDPGTYYVKEISPSPGFLLDPNVYPVSVTAGNTSSITSSEQPINDPFYIELYKLDRRESKYVNHLDEAQFTLRYYDAQTDNPSGSAKYTWIFRTAFDDEGKAIVKFDRAHYVGGDSIDALTNSAGLFFLPLGTFTIEETLAPKLYARDENVYVGRVQNVDGHAVASVNEKGYLDVNNLDLSQSEELQTVKLSIQKVDLETGKAELPEDHITNTATLKGGVFHIYRIGEYNTDKENPEIVSIPPVDYGTLTTDEEGKCSLEHEPGTTDGLLPGRFRIIEEKAPNGFAVNEKEFILDAPVKERNIATFEYSIDIGDKLTRIQIEKLDDKGDLIPEGATATIQLIETETGRVVYEFVADGQPHIIKGLTTMMNYHLHELYVAPNFRLAIDKDVNPIDANDSELHGSADPDHPYTNYYHMVDHGIEIHTTATFSDEGKKEWDNPSNKHYVADGIAHIFDEVSYKNVYEKETYILQGELFDKTDNRSLDNVVRKEFVPKYDVGIETLEFSQQLDDLDNHDLVVFESLYRVVTNDDGSKEEILVTEHKDLEDEDQTVHVDELYRADFEVLKINADDSEEVLEGVTFHITSHRIKRDGTVEDYDLGEFTTDENGKIFVEKLKEDTVLTITETKEKDPTWYRWGEPFTFDIGHDASITLHSYRIENHQIKIGTFAKFEESDSKSYVADGIAHIIDTVNYEWLYEGDQYRLVATLIDKGTKENPTEIEVKTVEHEFTAAGLNGSEEVSVEFNLDGYDNHDFVVFEELYHIVTKEVPQTDEEGNPVLDEEGNPVIDKIPTGEEPLVAKHKDIDDGDQTVHVDELYRAAMVLYKISNGNRDIKLNGAYFNVSTRRIKRDGTLVEKNLGTYVTGGIYYEEDAAFMFTVARDKEMNDVIKTVGSSYNANFKKQAVSILDLEDGIYYGKSDSKDAKVITCYVAKGTIFLPDQEEDTAITYKELVAPSGYALDRSEFTVSVGNDYTLERIENCRSNSIIINPPYIPETGYDGQ